jgi:hypothetical protein
MTAQTEAPAGSALIDPVMPVGCKCIERWNEHLMPKGSMLVMQPIVRWDETGASQEIGRALLIKVERSGSPRKGRAPTIYGKFCPFCGTRTVAA